MDWLKFGFPTPITVEIIRDLYPGLPEEYFDYIKDESSLYECDTKSIGGNEHHGCREDREIEPCAVSVPPDVDSTTRTHAPDRDIVSGDSDEL